MFFMARNYLFLFYLICCKKNNYSLNINVLLFINKQYRSARTINARTLIVLVN